MAFEGIIAQLDVEIAKLNEARSLLAATGKIEAKITAAKTKVPKKTRGPAKAAAKAKPKAKRVLSPEARRAIAEGQRKRWAAAKGSGG